MARISLVVAADDKNLIGRDNDLPWRLPNDLKHFKAVTLGKPILMGRKTFESIGKPLPGRRNLVLSRHASWNAPGVQAVTSFAAARALTKAEPELMVIGGAHVYAATLPKADRIYLTRVHATLEGDTWFPAINPTQWRVLMRERHGADERHEFDYSFIVLERKVATATSNNYRSSLIDEE